MEIKKMTINDYDEVYDLWINTTGMKLNNKEKINEKCTFSQVW